MLFSFRLVGSQRLLKTFQLKVLFRLLVIKVQQLATQDIIVHQEVLLQFLVLLDILEPTIMDEILVIVENAQLVHTAQVLVSQYLHNVMLVIFAQKEAF